jgi:ATP-binding cassette subfamily B protein
VFNLLGALWVHIEKTRKKQLIFVIILMFTASLLEVISIGAVIPFLGVLSSPEKVFESDEFQNFIRFFDINSAGELLIPLTAIFCGAAVFSGLMRLLLLWAMNRVSFSTGADLSINVYRHLLYQNYSFHLKHSSSSAITSVTSKVDAVIYQVLFQVLSILSSILILSLIFIALLLINPLLTILSFFGFGVLYGGIIFLTKNHLQKNSYLIAKESTEAVKCLQEGLGGIRDIIIDNSQSTYCEIYNKADLSLQHEWNQSGE